MFHVFMYSCMYSCIHVFVANTNYTFTIYAAPLTVDIIGGNGSLVGSGNISLTLWVSISLRVPPCMHACVHVCVSVSMHAYVQVCVCKCTFVQIRVHVKAPDTYLGVLIPQTPITSRVCLRDKLVLLPS